MRYFTISKVAHLAEVVVVIKRNPLIFGSTILNLEARD